MEELDFRITEVTRVIERQNAAGWRVENMQYENEFVVVIVLEGETEYMIGNEKYLAHKNDVLIFPPKVLRSGRFTQSMELCIGYFSHEFKSGSKRVF